MYTSLKKTQNILSKIDSINRGGCGIAALTIYKSFINKNNIKILFLYRDFEIEDFKHNKEILSKNSKKRIEVPEHIVLSINNKLIDSTGDVTKLYKNRLKQKVTLKFLIDSINKGEWNSSFDRRNIEYIEKSTGIKLIEITRRY